MNGWRRCSIYIYNGILLIHRKEWNNAICSNMDGPRDYLTKWSKSERERQIPYAITYMWNLKYDKMNLSVKQKWTHRYREHTYGCQGWGDMGGGWIGSLGLADANYYI